MLKVLILVFSSSFGWLKPGKSRAIASTCNQQRNHLNQTLFPLWGFEVLSLFLVLNEPIWTNLQMNDIWNKLFWTLYIWANKLEMQPRVCQNRLFQSWLNLLSMSASFLYTVSYLTALAKTARVCCCAQRQVQLRTFATQPDWKNLKLKCLKWSQYSNATLLLGVQCHSHCNLRTYRGLPGIASRYLHHLCHTWQELNQHNWNSQAA